MNSVPAGQNRRVLVIDDNRSIHDDFRKILFPATATAAALDDTEAAVFGRPTDAVRPTRFEVDSAYQGEEGVLLVKHALEAGRPYAVAFVDVRMPPGWDGVETTRKMWELDPDLQVVLCTAYSDYSWDEMFQKLGSRDGLLILKKPFDAVEAFQLAHALTEKWWLHQASRQKVEELESQVAERTSELQQTNHALQTEVVEHTRAEEALRESANRYQTLLENAPVAVFVNRADRVVLANAACLRLFGATAPEQLLGKSPIELFHPDFHAAIRERIQHLMAKSNVVPLIEEKIIRLDGTPVDVEVTAALFQDQGVNAIHVVLHDITERKRAEKALRESNEKFRQLADNISDAFWIRSPDMREVHYISPAFERIWGRSVESLYADPQQWSDFILPEDRERVLDAFAALTEDARSLDIEYRIVRPDGEIRWIRVRGFHVRDAADKLIRHTGIVTDITERHRAAEELRESERRFSDMLRNLELVSMMLDRDGRIIYCNDYLLRLTGWQREEVIGRDWFELFLPPELVNELRGVHSALLADQPVAWHHENDIITRSGARRLIRWNNSVLRSASGYVIGTASIGEDITERKRLEAQLFQSQKMETVGKLAGGVAHEFNSILTVIIGRSELLLEDLPPGDPLSKNADEIRNAAGRAATLTRQLLAYGRKQFLRPETLDLNHVIGSMEVALRHLMGGEVVDVNIVPAVGLHLVQADVGQIEQVIMNMAINALEAMPKGGKLTLETANVSFDQESANRYPELTPGDYVTLAITDTGAGMSPEVEARVFEPFFSTKGMAEATGLGLSTCYGIIKQSGGHIKVCSELGRGSTFTIYLPQIELQSRNPIQALASLDLPRGTETILLVDDDPALREMAAILLRRLGYTVFVAANGIDALSLQQRHDIGQIDLLFTDVVMPEMSGQELSERVRALCPQIRILLSSGYSEEVIARQGALNDGLALLPKPFTPSALAHKLREVLDQPSSPKDLEVGNSNSSGPA